MALSEFVQREHTIVLAVDRDGARQLFGCRQSGDWDQVVQQLLASTGPGHACDLAEHAAEVRALLTAHGALEAALPEAQPLAVTEQQTVWLIRPDLVARLAENWPNCGAGSDTSEPLGRLRELYVRAASDGRAVVCLRR
jgi:hypothetical protein